VSVELVKDQISKTSKTIDWWMFFLWFCLFALIFAIIYCIYIGIKQNYVFALLNIVFVPLLGVVIKAVSDQNKANVDLISALNETQAIANNQDEILRSIKIEELADKERGG